MDSDFVNYLNISVKDAYVNNEGLSETIVNELVQASLRCNYGQTTNVHEFVGSVSMAGMDGQLWSVNGGMYNIDLKKYHDFKIKFAR